MIKEYEIRLLIDGQSYFIFLPNNAMIKLMSKGNGKNYLWFVGDEILEFVKIRGSFYRLKYKNGSLIPVGDALTKNQYTLIN